MKFNLNRSFKNFPITRVTPDDVIVFLMKTTGKTLDKEKIEKKFDKIKAYLESFEDYIQITDSYSHSDLNKITTYISDLEYPWSVRNLLDSFNHLVIFHTKFSLPDTDTISFGSKNNDNPLSYDICMCYMICIKLNIKVNKDDTLDSMRDKILEASRNREEHYNLVKNNINNLNALELYQVSKNINIKEKPYQFKGNESLENLSKNINISYIIRNSILNNEEAIVYAAKFFNYDISESSHPISVLKSITDRKDEITFSIEDVFTKRFRINESYYKLDKFWRKNISFLYTPKHLSNLKEYENLDDDQDLDKRYTEDNYYDGILDFSKGKEIIDKRGIITFGNISTGSIEVTNINKLIEIFKQKLCFHKYEKNIEKLVNICKENKTHEHASLYKIIRFIQKYCLVTNDAIKNLKSSSEKYKDTIREIFDKLLEVSQSLKGKEKVDDFSNISIMNNILNLNKYLSDIKNQELKKMIDELPIINYKNEKFCKPLENHYKNIVEDLSNTKNLKDKTSEYLRNKSNYYAYTAYYYVYIFYKEHLFDIEKF